MSRFLDFEVGDKELTPLGGYWQQSLVPLEIALKPILSRIDQLDRSIKEAKKRCHYPSEHNLTREESAAVYLYTMEGGDNSFYHILNEALRTECRPALKPWFGFLKLFDTALNKLPNVQKCVWRGVQGDISHKFKENQLLTWWSVSSCSTALKVVQDFLGTDTKSTLIMIEAKNAKDISGYTSFPYEKEVLLGPGTKLRVESNALNHLGGLHVVHLVEVNDDDDEDNLPKDMANINLSSISSQKGAFGELLIHFFL
jgi:hypothetical protein